jgi:hypothetical protein
MSLTENTEKRQSPIEPKTVGEALFWSYANLTMAYASKRHSLPTYQKVDYIVRNKNYHGLLRGKLKLGSFFKDEKSKIASSDTCCYCGSQTALSMDHLVPQFSGGAHSADNLIVACRSCNSSKGKIEFLEWMDKRNQFPPLQPLRRYLKLAIIYCTENDLMNVPLQSVSEIDPAPPVALARLPYCFPEPQSLRERIPIATPA